ncbi:MAG: MaoC/PaaZ C-terminal domain-containing protein [Gammaproteobacteria bacterium]|jgi:acyl dehydratase|nr:MaoC/PaaZ C-terminal domain-containing protein [Gammaproteobacteria bacterium]
MQGRHYEEFKLGECFTTSRRTISETDIVHFVNLAGLTEPLFTDKEHWESIFGKRLAPGFLTLAISQGLMVQLGLTHGTAQGLLGIDEIRTPKPVFCDDTIHVEIEIVDQKHTKHPDRGILKLKLEVKNQNEEMVLSYFHTMLVCRRVISEQGADRS